MLTKIRDISYFTNFTVNWQRVCEGISWTSGKLWLHSRQGGKKKLFFFLESVHIVPATDPESYSIGTEVFPISLKLSGPDADHSLPHNNWGAGTTLKNMVWNLVSHSEGGSKTEGVREWGAEEDIWA
jgi:hypothetical protein